MSHKQAGLGELRQADGSEGDDSEELLQHLERLTLKGAKGKENKKRAAALLRKYLEIIEKDKDENDDGVEDQGSADDLQTTVVVDTEGRQPPPISKSDPTCFADTEGGGFEVPEYEDDGDYEEEEEEITASSEYSDAKEESDDSDKAEELHEDLEKEAEDKLSQRFLDYDKVWEYAMATVRHPFFFCIRKQKSTSRLNVF
jgi:hypothetical protein